jgi:hypothetical protein
LNASVTSTCTISVYMLGSTCGVLCLEPQRWGIHSGIRRKIGCALGICTVNLLDSWAILKISNQPPTLRILAAVLIE